MALNSYSRKRAQDEEVTDLMDLTLYQEALAGPPTDSQMVDLGTLTMNWRDPKGRRGAPRYNLKRTILVSNYQRAFRTQIENISLTGARLKDILPADFLNVPFDIVLIDEQENQQKTYLNFRGRAVQTEQKSNRVVFDSITDLTANRLTELVGNLTPA
jgi:hypothetical protein